MDEEGEKSIVWWWPMPKQREEKDHECSLGFGIGSELLNISTNGLSRKSLNVVVTFCDGAMLGRCQDVMPGVYDFLAK